MSDIYATTYNTPKKTWIDKENTENKCHMSPQTHFPGEKNASISLNVDDTSIDRSRVLCRHSRFSSTVVFLST